MAKSVKLQIMFSSVSESLDCHWKAPMSVPKGRRPVNRFWQTVNRLFTRAEAILFHVPLPGTHHRIHQTHQPTNHLLCSCHGTMRSPVNRAGHLLSTKREATEATRAPPNRLGTVNSTHWDRSSEVFVHVHTSMLTPLFRQTKWKQNPLWTTKKLMWWKPLETLGIHSPGRNILTSKNWTQPRAFLYHVPGASK